MRILSSGEYLTIDIGFRYIKIAQVRQKKNSNELMIVNYGIGNTPKGCIKNGAIKEKDKVIGEIESIIKENNLTAKNAKIVISGTNIITRIIMVEKVSDDIQEERIWDEIACCLPINIDDHKVDFKILGMVTNDGEEEVKVFVTAVSKRIILSYVDLLRKLNLKPVSVDIPANSVSKFFKRNIDTAISDTWARKQRQMKRSTSDTVAVIDLGSETTIVNVLKNKVPEFNRVTLLGSSNIDRAISTALNMEENMDDWAERYKKMYGLVSKNDEKNDLEWECSNAAKAVINEVILNIRMCFDFYKSRCAGEDISRIYLIGGGSQMKGLKEYFEKSFNAPTYPIGQVRIDGVRFAPVLDKGKVSYLINALGAAL